MRESYALACTANDIRATDEGFEKYKRLLKESEVLDAIESGADQGYHDFKDILTDKKADLIIKAVFASLLPLGLPSDMIHHITTNITELLRKRYGNAKPRLSF